MKHPVKFFAILFLLITAVSAAILMTMRYMDVLQKQFDFLRGLLARRNSESSHDDGFNEEYKSEEEDLASSFSNEDYPDEEMKF